MASIKEITESTYRRTPGTDLSAYKIDIKTFNIITAMDGTRSVASVAREDSYEIEDLVERVNELVGMGLLESVYGGGGGGGDGGGGGGGNVVLSFISELQTELTDMVGPVAGKLIRKKISELGYDVSAFPEGRIGELIDMLSNILQDHGKRADFKHRMMAKLNK